MQPSQWVVSNRDHRRLVSHVVDNSTTAKWVNTALRAFVITEVPLPISLQEMAANWLHQEHGCKTLVRLGAASSWSSFHNSLLECCRVARTERVLAPRNDVTQIMHSI